MSAHRLILSNALVTMYLVRPAEPPHSMFLAHYCESKSIRPFPKPESTGLIHRGWFLSDKVFVSGRSIACYCRNSIE